ncbi:MAG: hypothetical protein F4Z77_13330 [Dehalococcoidia bacterium]|nr:hypothetical protein [Chloroflexota bacterium]MXW27256.1 hypothetical protein [Dehalococcoidia bacterium]MXY87402.1 hypothetical protein [Dehalococcoidia bacterium]MYA53409.1 hypothetical protein [Dehalococcoidia bacterium]
MAFDTLRAAQRLREGGADEPLAEAVVEVVVDATSELVTREYFDERMERLDERFTQFDARMTLHEQSLDNRMDARFEAFRAEMYRMFAIQGGVILGGVGVIVALVETLG